MGAQAVRLSNVDIDNALKNKDFEVLFQPIFDLSTGAFARVEAFVRWRHRALGVLPPGAFISYFETQGRMSELTRYVLDRALAEYLAWRGPQEPGFSINLALSDLADDGFANHLSVHLRDRGIAPELITLECPMPPVTMDQEAAAAYFGRLSDTGVRLAIEVRGRANDFLKTIEPFPFDEIKTGGAAILRFARTVRGPGLSAIAELLEIAQKARSSIVAVGVEDQASLAALRSLGFTAAQGNHLAQVGGLAQLPFAKVNDVRQLLGLAPYSDAEIAAMSGQAESAAASTRMRRAAPQPISAPVEAQEAPIKAASNRDTIERLNARIARQNETAGTDADERARIKAALGAKKGSALTKAAAIAKAKRKGGVPDAGLQDAADGDWVRDVETASDAPLGDSLSDAPEAAPEPAPARRLIDRLARAFDKTQNHEPGDNAPPEAAPAAAIAESRPVKRDELPPGPPAQPPAASTPKTVSLPVGMARAYFRPAVYVAAAPYQPIEEALRASGRDDILEFRVEDTPPTALVSPHKDAVVIPAPPALRDEPSLPGAAAPRGPLDAEDVHAVPTLAAPTARRRRTRKKPTSFLKRRFYISHFWPRSWKQWWARSMAAKTERA